MNKSKCPFANLLGEPNKGPHSIRFLGLALVDILLTFLGAGIISYLLKSNYFMVLLYLLILGELLHYIFGVETAFLKMIGVKINCSN